MRPGISLLQYWNLVATTTTHTVGKWVVHILLGCCLVVFCMVSYYILVQSNKMSHFPCNVLIIKLGTLVTLWTMSSYEWDMKSVINVWITWYEKVSYTGMDKAFPLDYDDKCFHNSKAFWCTYGNLKCWNLTPKSNIKV